jgi:aryl-alcohol dehydrogenase-like predicted oxidoreductase
MSVTLPNTDLAIAPLCLGGNVFGWTADADQSFDVLDAFVAAGGNFIDTADAYSAWKPGNVGGESEQIIGDWLTRRGRRDDVVIGTKVGKLKGHDGLTARNIRTQCEASLRRLQTDYIDIYYAHADDPTTPLEETMAAFDALVSEGKVRYVAASNYSAPRLLESLRVSRDNNLAPFIALQPYYNLLVRTEFETELLPVCQQYNLATFPYYSLERGFLTGKYRKGEASTSVRSERGALTYANDRGWQALAALDEIAAAHRTTVAAVALAWLAAQPTVAAPIASARTPEQLNHLLMMFELRLTPAELSAVAAATAE